MPGWAAIGPRIPLFASFQSYFSGTTSSTPPPSSRLVSPGCRVYPTGSGKASIRRSMLQGKCRVRWLSAMPDQVCARLYFPRRRIGRGPCSEPSLAGTNLGHPAVPNRKRNSRAMNMCVCQKCSSKRMRRAVCADCHEQMMTRLGTEIRRLQGEILELRISANLLRVIGQSAVRRIRQGNADGSFGSSTDLVKLTTDHTP